MWATVRLIDFSNIIWHNQAMNEKMNRNGDYSLGEYDVDGPDDSSVEYADIDHSAEDIVSPEGSGGTQSPAVKSDRHNEAKPVVESQAGYGDALAEPLQEDYGPPSSPDLTDYEKGTSVSLGDRAEAIESMAGAANEVSGAYGLIKTASTSQGYSKLVDRYGAKGTANIIAQKQQDIISAEAKIRQQADRLMGDSEEIKKDFPNYSPEHAKDKLVKDFNDRYGYDKYEDKTNSNSADRKKLVKKTRPWWEKIRGKKVKKPKETSALGKAGGVHPVIGVESIDIDALKKDYNKRAIDPESGESRDITMARSLDEESRFPIDNPDANQD